MDPVQKMDEDIRLQVEDAIADRFSDTGPIRVIGIEEVRVVQTEESVVEVALRAHVLMPHEMAVPLVA